MTPTEQWIFCLALVYAVPSFIGGVAVTLLFVRWQDASRTLATLLTFEGRDFEAAGTPPGDAVDRHLADRLRLR